MRDVEEYQACFEVRSSVISSQITLDSGSDQACFQVKPSLISGQTKLDFKSDQA
jgi:hypothetical protein